MEGNAKEWMEDNAYEGVAYNSHERVEGNAEEWMEDNKDE